MSDTTLTTTIDRPVRPMRLPVWLIAVALAAAALAAAVALMGDAAAPVGRSDAAIAAETARWNGLARAHAADALQAHTHLLESSIGHSFARGAAGRAAATGAAAAALPVLTPGQAADASRLNALAVEFRQRRARAAYADRLNELAAYLLS